MIIYRDNKGFALATVMIASLVMIIVLLSAIQATMSMNTAIGNQYYTKLIQEASESGLTKANACLAKNSQIAEWTDAKPLLPNTDCKGDIIAGQSSYVLETTNLKTSFSVGAPVVSANTQRVNAVGSLGIYRTSGIVGALPVKEYTNNLNAIAGAQNTFSTVTFGYSYASATPATSGAFFTVVLPNGEVKTIGINADGRLGNGTTVDSLTPQKFILPGSERGVAAYANFLAVGYSLFVVTNNGKVYGSGLNDSGQLGAGTITAQESTPKLFNLPAGVSARFISTMKQATYVIGSDNNIYAAGSCTYGETGTGTGCVTSGVPKRVALPAVNLSDPNTIPETAPGWTQPNNMEADRNSAFIRMKGGYVYGWGSNTYGMLGDGTFVSVTTPKRLQALSSFASPTASAISFNGASIYVLDTNGRVWAAGDNRQGQQAGTGTLIQNKGNTDVCMRNSSAGIMNAQYDCDAADGWQYMEFWPDKTWRFRTDSRSYNPTDSMLCATAPATIGTTQYIRMNACTGATNQKWTWTSDFRLKSDAVANACAEPSGNMYLYTCRATTDANYKYQTWTNLNNPYLRPMPVPPGAPKITKISTDFSSVYLLDENGNVWASGANGSGQQGTGTLDVFNPALEKVSLPAGLQAVDVYNAEAVASGYSVYNNTYFIMSDGSVYGTGANTYGQLGNGTTASSVTIPVKMQLPAGVVASSVQAGFGTAIILTTKGQIYTVGNNSNGQLGDGTTTNSSIPKVNTYTNQRAVLQY